MRAKPAACSGVVWLPILPHAGAVVGGRWRSLIVLETHWALASWPAARMNSRALCSREPLGPLLLLPALKAA